MSADAKRREVDEPQYLELLVSRRKLDWVAGRPGWLRDRESDELFVLRVGSALRFAQPA